MSEDKRKGLRFEVEPVGDKGWVWTYVGAEGIICRSFQMFETEPEARSHIHTNRGRLGNAKRAKVVTVLDD